MKKPLTNCSSKAYRSITRLALGIGILLAGCQRQTAPGEEVIMRYGEEELRRAEVDLFTPDGLTGADSAAYADAYIEQWISLQTMAAEAQGEVDSEQDELKYKLARYEQQLIAQAFTERLVAERPALSQVSEADIRGYYQRHQQNFVAQENWYQFFYVKTPLSGQYRVVNQLRSSDTATIAEVKAWARENATSWRLDSSWVTEPELMKVSEGYYSGDIRRAYPGAVYGYAHTEEGTTYYDFFKMIEVVDAGELLPLAVCRERIAQIIRNQRKNALIDETKAMLVQQAKSSGKIVDYRSQ